LYFSHPCSIHPGAPWAAARPAVGAAGGRPYAYTIADFVHSFNHGLQISLHFSVLHKLAALFLCKMTYQVSGRIYKEEK